MTRAPILALLTLGACGLPPVDWNQYRQEASHAPLIACAIDPERITLYPPPSFRSPVDGRKVQGEYDHATDQVRTIRRRAAIYHELTHRGLRLAGIRMGEWDEELFVIRYLSHHFPGLQNSTTTGAERRQARERWSESDIEAADRKGCGR